MGKKTKSKKSTNTITDDRKLIHKTEHHHNKFIKKQQLNDNNLLSKVSNLDEIILCKKFDSQISIESSMPEEGIQAARDIYTDVVKCELLMRNRMEYLIERKNSLITTNEEMKRSLTDEKEQVKSLEMQVARLRSLSEDLNKKKDSLVAECEKKTDEQRLLRQEKSDEFMAQVQGISVKLEEQSEARTKQAAEHEELKTTLRNCLDRYQSSETDFNDQMASYTSKIEEALKQYETECAACEKERTKCAKYEKQVQGMLDGERALRGQVAQYADRFEQFQEALNKSNDMFSSFKTRMEEMTRTIRRLEKENAELENKRGKSLETIDDMAAQHTSMEGAIGRVQKQIGTLNGLISTLTEDIDKKKLEISKHEEHHE